MLVVTRQLHFWHLVNEMSTSARSSIAKAWWDNFHCQPHPERVRFLEARGTNASTIIFWIHLNMTFFGLYKNRFVIMRPTKGFDGALAMKEIAMALFLTATDTRRESYKEDDESHVQIYKPDTQPADSILVCGLSASQVDPRNQFLLSFCEELITLHENDEGGEYYQVKPPCKSLTNNSVSGIDGSNGRKHMFFGEPICFTSVGNLSQEPSRRREFNQRHFLHSRQFFYALYVPLRIKSCGGC